MGRGRSRSGSSAAGEPVLLPTPGPGPPRSTRLADEVGAELVVLDPALPLGLVGPALRPPYGVVLHGAEVTVPGRLPGSRAACCAACCAGPGSSSPPAATRRPRASGPPAAACPTSWSRRASTPTASARSTTPSSAGRARARFGLPADGPLVVARQPARAPQGLRHADPGRGAGCAPGHPDLAVAIAGGGRDQARLERLVGRAGRPGPLPRAACPTTTCPALYGCADVFAMLCRNRWAGLEQEGFGIVFLEAAACGVPQVAGGSGGAAEAVVHGETGLVVDRPADRRRAVAGALGPPARRPGRAPGDGRGRPRRRAEEEFAYDVLAGPPRAAPRRPADVTTAAARDRPGRDLRTPDVVDRASSWSPSRLGRSAPTPSRCSRRRVASCCFLAGCVGVRLGLLVAVGRSRTDADRHRRALLPHRIRAASRSASPAGRLGRAGRRDRRRRRGGTPFTGRAFGVLAPLFGLGMTGVVGRPRTAHFPPDDPRGRRPAPVRTDPEHDSRSRSAGPMADQATETPRSLRRPTRSSTSCSTSSAYPEWARDLKGVEVARHATPRAGLERALPRRRHGPEHQLHAALRLLGRPGRARWALSEGDITRKLDGSYASRRGRRPATDVDYQLEVELVVPLPGFVKRGPQTKIMHTALRELKAHVERSPTP